MKMAKSTQTTVGGIILAVGMLLNAIGEMLKGQEVDWVQVLSAAMAAGGGWWLGSKARDDGVTSEGTIAKR